MNDSRFQFHFQEHDLGRGLVQYIVLDAGLAKVGCADPKLGLGALPVGRHDGHFARGHRNDHVIHLVNVMAGGAARRKPPLGDADFGGIDLNLGFGGQHFGTSQGTNTINTNTANTTMWTSPNRMLVRPVPKVSMLSMKVSSNSTSPCSF